MKGIVVVSHSRKFAEGAVELIKMTAPDLCIAAAGGLEDDSLGTSYEKIKTAIESVYSDDGVLVIPDMGSSVMTAEMVIEELSMEGKDNIEISNLHLTEEVTSLCLKIGEKEKREETTEKFDTDGFTFVVKNAVGIHARPAAELVRFCQELGAKVTAEANGKVASCTNLIDLLSLGAGCGTEVRFTLEGDKISEKTKQLRMFVEKNL